MPRLIKISKRDAITAGLTKFYTGKPCIKGHVTHRTVWKGNCVECQRLSIEAWGVKNRAHKLVKSAEYRKNNRKRILEYHDQARKSLKQQAMAAYGGKCSCCGENEIDFLTIDHIGGGGRAHRAKIGSATYRWLKLNNYPKRGFRVLCFNCNCAIGMFGVCPHQRKKS